MSNVLKSVASFFKSRRTNVTIGPRISVDYDIYTYVEDTKIAIKKQWEQLRKEIELHPECIQKQEWQRYRKGERQEKLILELEEVVIELEGPYYPDPDYVPAKPEPPKLEKERADETVDALLQQTSLIWAITHCSELKYRRLIQFLEATRITGKRN